MNEHYKFVNHPLPYAYEAMEPYIDEKTMHLHHDRHLQTYIDNLNHTLSGYPEFQGWTPEQLIARLLPQALQRAGSLYRRLVSGHQLGTGRQKLPELLSPGALRVLKKPGT